MSNERRKRKAPEKAAAAELPSSQHGLSPREHTSSQQQMTVKEGLQGCLGLLVVVAILVGVVSCGIRSCGGSSHQKPSQTAAATPREHTCQAAWHCGDQLTENDLIGTFNAWPEVQSVYRNGNSYVVYTNLGKSGYSRAVDICITVFEDLVGANVTSPDISVLSAGGPAVATALATGATPGNGCSSLAP